MTSSPVSATAAGPDDANPLPVPSRPEDVARARPASATGASIRVVDDPTITWLLRLGDTCLIQAQRLGEWSGHAPIIEEDIALSNMALDLLGQARALLTHAGTLHGRLGDAYDEDQLAFLRDERDYRNVTLTELPRGDFAFTVVRNLMLATWWQAQWTALTSSRDTEVAAIAGKAVKEARYHQQHAAEWTLRLGDGTDESARRMREAVALAWPYANELFDDDAVDAHVAGQGLGPASSSLAAEWQAEMAAVLDAAGLAVPAPTRFLSTGKRGRHSEHLGRLLTELQYLQRAYPGGAW